jgi:hypothetical protein
MKKASILSVALVALFVAGAMIAASAFALPELLPHGKWEGKQKGTALLESTSGTKVECKKGKGSGEETTDTLGKFSIDFEECNCKSNGDAAGVILTGGEYHYVFDSLTTLGVAVLFLTVEVKLEGCTFGTVNVKPGKVLCLIKEPLVAGLTHTFKCEQKEGKATEKTFWNDEGKEVASKLECTLIATVECSELAEAEVTYKEANAFEHD